MPKDWLKELNELDDRYQYGTQGGMLFRSHIIGGREYTNRTTEECAKERLKELRHIAGRDVDDVRLWLQENLSEPKQLQLLWVLQANPLSLIEQIMQYKLTNIARICTEAFGIAPEGEE